MTRPNGLKSIYAYDNLSRLTSVLHQTSGSTTLDCATYTVDNAGTREGFLSVDPVSQSKACSVLKGLSVNGSAGLGLGGGLGFTPDFGASKWGAGDPANWTLQAGVVSPQLGVGASWGFYLGNDKGGRGCGCDNN